jgi:fatty-acyl-CoA synthase
LTLIPINAHPVQEIAYGSGQVGRNAKGQIAHYKIPRHWRFVDSFPMTVTGKIQKYKMREQAIEELNLAAAAAVVTA